MDNPGFSNAWETESDGHKEGPVMTNDWLTTGGGNYEMNLADHTWSNGSKNHAFADVDLGMPR